MRRNTATAEGVHPFSVLSPEKNGMGSSCPKEKVEDSLSASARKRGQSGFNCDSQTWGTSHSHCSNALYLVFLNLQLSFSAFYCLLITLPLVRFHSKTTTKRDLSPSFPPSSYCPISFPPLYQAFESSTLLSSLPWSPGPPLLQQSGFSASLF